MFDLDLSNARNQLFQIDNRLCFLFFIVVFPTLIRFFHLLVLFSSINFVSSSLSSITVLRKRNDQNFRLVFSLFGANEMKFSSMILPKIWFEMFGILVEWHLKYYWTRSSLFITVTWFPVCINKPIMFPINDNIWIISSKHVSH